MKTILLSLIMTLFWSGISLAAEDAPAGLALLEPAVKNSEPAKKDVFASDPYTGMEFVFVKGGCFRMGSEIGGPDEKPVHEVCLSDYYIGKYEVTQAEWKKVMGGNPSHFSTCGADCPVESVSWFSSQDFIQKLGVLSGRSYRLPTEAEWEYAGRSGGRDEKFVGTNDEAVLDHYAWYEKNSGEMTHRVGQKKANALGIHDMSGNVQEWCYDWYDEAYYSKSPRNNPAGAPTGESRVLRGGSWNFDASLARASSRFWIEPGVMGSLGLRLVFSAKQVEPATTEHESPQASR